MSYRSLPLPAFVLVLIVSCTAFPSVQEARYLPYDLSSPHTRIQLPDTLNEVSGLVLIDSTTVACVQDENGVLFLYDLQAQRIARSPSFHDDGDYEGIARIGNAIWILRSDGTLFGIRDFTADSLVTEAWPTGIPADNNEGLCYDAANDRLLIACKGKLGKGPEWKDRRAIYAFDLRTHQLSAEPTFDFDLAVIRAFAVEKGVRFPHRERKDVNEPVIRFRPSAIGIHPLSGELYVLSAVDHALFVFSMDGVLQHIELLDEGLFNKAEGISFFPNGDLLITNEAQDKHPTLLVFRKKAS